MTLPSLKNTTTLILIALSLVACQSPADISGRLSGTDKKFGNIYLIEPETLWNIAAPYLGKVIDSAVIDSNGYFEFKNLPEFKVPTLLELAIQLPNKTPNYLETEDLTKSNYMPIVWQTGEHLKITAKLDKFQKSLSIKNPSEINKELLDLRNINQSAYKTYLAEKDWDVHNASKLMEEEDAILQYKKQLIQFSKNTPYLIPAMAALRWVSPERDYERVPEFLVSQCAKWKKRQPNHPWVKQLCKVADPNNLPVLIGDIFPNIKLPMHTKDTVSLNNQLGDKLTIIDLWASWCGPCRIENQETLVPIWDDYYKQGLQIIAYGLESDEDNWSTAITRDGADRWLHASDLQGDDASFLKDIRIQTIPSNFILDKKGIVLAKNIHGESLINFIKDYMKAK